MEPEPSKVPEPRPGPSRLPEPRPRPSRLPEPRPGTSRDPEPRPGPSKLPEPRPSRKSDEELLREHGIDRECRVVLSSDFILNHGDSLVPNKGFRVHYGRQFLFQIAQLSFRHPSAPLDMDRLYSTYITSRFSTLDRPNFKGILRSYFAQWEEECRKRRALLLKAKMDQVNARRKAEREARRRCKITYRNKSVIVPRGSIEQVKIALRNSSRSRVLLERIFVDDAPAGVTAAGNPPADAVPVGSPQSATNVSESQCDTAPGSVSGDVEDSRELPGSSSSRSAISDSPPHFMYLGSEKIEDRRTAISGLITDLIAKVSDEQDHDGGASNPDMSSTDCYSDDTVESPMEVEFESGESPDFSKVLRDSEETCHGDDFYEVATANQQSLGNSNADKGSCVNQKTITRSHDKPSHKKSMKL